MYTNYSDSYVARVVSDEKISSKREPIELAFEGVWINTLKRSVKRAIESLQIRWDLRQVPQPIRQVACQEVPQYC